MHAIALGLALSLLSSTALASRFEQKGQPEHSIATMSSYGVEVATRNGLRTVVPSGWQLFIHKQVTLPSTMSWNLGDEWPTVLADFAEKTGISVLVDWSARSVFFRPISVALEESAKVAEIQQAATTPLPTFRDSKASESALALEARIKALEDRLRAAEDEKKQADALRLAAEEAAKRLALRADKVAEVAADGSTRPPAPAPAPQPSVAEAPAPAAVAPLYSEGHLEAATTERVARALQLKSGEGAAAPVAPTVETTPVAVESQSVTPVTAPVAPKAADPAFTYTTATAWNKASARSLTQGIANRYGLRLRWMVEDVNLRGPVTLLGNSAAEDLELLSKALGPDTNVVIEFGADETVILGYAKDGRNLPEPEEPLAPEPVGTTAVAAEESAPPAPAFVLDIRPKQPLEDALARFARSKGYTLEWRLMGGFESNREQSYSGNSMAEVLTEVLPPLGLSADIYIEDRNIVVRPADAATDY